MENSKKVLSKYYESNKKVRIKADIYPILFRDDEWKKMKDTGIDTVEFNEFQHGKLGDKSAEIILNYTEEFGLDTDIGLFKGWLDKYYINRAFDYDFKKHPCIKEIHVYDEPDYNQIDICKKLSEDIENHIDYLPVVTNLFPAYVADGYLGSTYEEYIEKAFKELVVPRKNGRYTSCDFYPFETVEGDITMNDKWVYNHKLFADYAKKYDSEIIWCIQTSNYFLHRVVRKEDVLMQMYMCLAFGVKSIVLFTYGTPLLHPDFPDGCNGMVGHNFQPNSMYYDTKDAITEIRKIEKIAMSFNYNAAKTYIGKNNVEKKNTAFDIVKDQAKDFEQLENIECSEDTIVSEMYDKENGRYGYYIINYTDPFYRIKDSVKITLKNCVGMVAIIKGEPVEINSKTTDIVLDEGEGIFVLPLKD